MTFPTDDLFWSYRLAKFEVAAERRGVGRLNFSRYEQNLAANLEQLGRSTHDNANIFKGLSPGRVWIRPKAVKQRKPREKNNGSFIRVEEVEHDHAIAELSVRVLLEPSPAFATAEVLWLRTYGPALESLLGDDCRANRLELRGTPPEVNGGGRRVFQYWGSLYRQYRDEAMNVATSALRNPPNRCTLATLDITSYYDCIDPSFLLSPPFLAAVRESAATAGIPFSSPSFIDATTGLLDAYAKYWAEVESVVDFEPHRGIPIGALSSRLIANLALSTFDDYVRSRPGVIHYGRYVDDILIVSLPIDNESPRAALGRLLPLNKKASREGRLVIDEAFLGRSGSTFAVQREKLRVFELSGEPGTEYLKTIRSEFERLSSERKRFLEPWSEDADQAITASPDGEPIRALRQADALSLRRYALGTICGKVTSAATMLEPSEAAAYSQRHLGKAGRLATDWSRWVDFLDVSLNILAAALVSHDARTANEVISALFDRIRSLAGTKRHPIRLRWTSVAIKARRARDLLHSWVVAQITELVCAAAPIGPDGFLIRDVGAIEKGLDGNDPRSPRELFEAACEMSSADLRLLDREAEHANGVSTLRRRDDQVALLAERLRDDAPYRARVTGIQELVDACKQQNDPVLQDLSPIDLLLMPQPPSYDDLLFRWVRAARPLARFLFVINSVRGTRYTTLPMFDDGHTIHVEPPPGISTGPHGAGRTRVVLGNLCSDDAWWASSVRVPTLSADRADRLARVLNQAMDAARRARRTARPSLLVLPELSVPRRWARQILRHVSKNQPALSLVLGLEYDVNGTLAYNEAIAYLPRPYHASVGWVWTKQRPAHHEGPALRKLGYRFAKRAVAQRFRVMSSEHGDFIPLICSELLEVKARARILGRIDILVVPSWNQDIPSFEYLVHASALELHSFVALANNGFHSDCRVRGPYGEAWRRDACRLLTRGEDETVIADLPIDLLREYRHSPRTYDRKRSAWLKKARRTGIPADKCPYPEWKPMPPGFKRK